MDEAEGVHGSFDGTIKRGDISRLGGAHLDAKFEVVGQSEMGMSLRGCSLSQFCAFFGMIQNLIFFSLPGFGRKVDPVWTASWTAPVFRLAS
jgi:hypothetical protein